MKKMSFYVFFALLVCTPLMAQTGPNLENRQPVIQVQRAADGTVDSSKVKVFLVEKLGSNLLELVENVYPQRQSILTLNESTLSDQVSHGDLLVLHRVPAGQSLVAAIIYTNDHGYIAKVNDVWVSDEGGYQLVHLAPPDSDLSQDNYVLTKANGRVIHQTIGVNHGQSISQAALQAGRILTAEELSSNPEHMIQISSITGLNERLALAEIAATQRMALGHNSLCLSLFRTF
jgi:hypothetical protein